RAGADIEGHGTSKTDHRKFFARGWNQSTDYRGVCSGGETCPWARRQQSASRSRTDQFRRGPARYPTILAHRADCRGFCSNRKDSRAGRHPRQRVYPSKMKTRRHFIQVSAAASATVAFGAHARLLRAAENPKPLRILILGG